MCWLRVRDEFVVASEHRTSVVSPLLVRSPSVIRDKSRTDSSPPRATVAPRPIICWETVSSVCRPDSDRVRSVELACNIAPHSAPKPKSNAAVDRRKWSESTAEISDRDGFVRRTDARVRLHLVKEPHDLCLCTALVQAAKMQAACLAGAEVQLPTRARLIGLNCALEELTKKFCALCVLGGSRMCARAAHYR